MVMCFVPGCRHYSEKKTCKFFVFPANPAEKKKWIKLIRRHDKEPSKHSLVCSCHFIDKNRKNTPTIFDLQSKKKSNSEAPKKRFPKSNREVAEKWCKALHLNIDNLTKSSVICSDHFWPHHIFKSGSRTNIITGAVPVLKRHGDPSFAATRSSLKVEDSDPLSDSSSVGHCFRDNDSSIATEDKSSSTSKDNNSSAKNRLGPLKPIPTPTMLKPSSGAVKAPKSQNFQDMFQRKVRHEILTDIARERMQMQGSTVSTRSLRYNSSKQNETQPPKFSAKPAAEYTASDRSAVFAKKQSAQPDATLQERTQVFSINTSPKGGSPFTRSNLPLSSTENTPKPLITQPGLVLFSAAPTGVTNSSVMTPQIAGQPSVITQNAPPTLVHLPQFPSNANNPVNSFIIIPHAPDGTPNGLFLLPQNLAQPNLILPPPLAFLPPPQQTGQISIGAGGTLQVSKDPRIGNSSANVTASTVRQVDSSITSQLSNSSTDTASETSYFFHNMEESFSKSSSEEKKSWCRTCLDPVPNQLEQASISMICFEEKTVKEGLVKLLPEMNSTLSDDHFVCAKCFMSLRNTLKFMKKCLEAESVIAKDMKKNPETENKCIESGDELEELEENDIHENINVAEDFSGDEDIDEEDVDNEEENDSAFEFDPKVDEQDYVLNGITNLIKASKGLKSKVDRKDSDLKDAVIKHLNFLTLQHAQVRNHNSILSIKNVEPEFIFSLQRNKIRLLQNCSKFDENIFTKKRLLLLGGHTEVKCLLCEEHFNTEAKMQDHISKVHGLSKAFLMETYCYQYRPGSSNECEACGKDCGNPISKISHLKSCYVFPCPYCDELFTASQLPSHTSEEHDDPKPFKCVRCKQEKVNFVKFKSHLCNALICEICGKNFLDQKRFRIHTDRCKSDEVIRKCSECKETFDASSFADHIKTHKLPCSVCGKIFNNRKNLYMHEYNHRLTNRALCPLCGKVVLSLKRHMKVHDVNRTKHLKCSQCPKSFFDKANLVKHIRKYHAATSIACGKCGILCNEGNIEYHYDSQHPHETVFNCAQCESTFTQIAFLKQHAKSHASELEMSKKSRKPRVCRVPRCDIGFVRKYKIRIRVPNTPITCKHCLKTLKGMLHYRRHLETHMKLYRHKCRYCDLTYSTPANKKRHEKLHKHPNYKFRCVECWKIMSSQEELDSHMVHHANKPKRYQCGECSELFCREYQLRSHLINKHAQQADIEEARDEIMKDALMDFAVDSD